MKTNYTVACFFAVIANVFLAAAAEVSGQRQRKTIAVMAFAICVGFALPITAFAQSSSLPLGVVTSTNYHGGVGNLTIETSKQQKITAQVNAFDVAPWPGLCEVGTFWVSTESVGTHAVVALNGKYSALRSWHKVGTNAACAARHQAEIRKAADGGSWAPVSICMDSASGRTTNTNTGGTPTAYPGILISGFNYASHVEEYYFIDDEVGLGWFKNLDSKGYSTVYLHNGEKRYAPKMSVVLSVLEGRDDFAGFYTPQTGETLHPIVSATFERGSDKRCLLPNPYYSDAHD